MSQQRPDIARVRLPVAPLGAWKFGALVATSVLVSGIFLLRSPDAALVALLGGAASVPGVLVSLGLLASLRPLPPVDLAFRILGISVVRLGVSLGVALLINFAAQPESLPFWMGFLAPALAVLGVESVRVRSALARALDDESGRTREPDDARTSDRDSHDTTTPPFRAEATLA